MTNEPENSTVSCTRCGYVTRAGAAACPGCYAQLPTAAPEPIKPARKEKKGRKEKVTPEAIAPPTVTILEPLETAIEPQAEAVHEDVRAPIELGDLECTTPQVTDFTQDETQTTEPEEAPAPKPFDFSEIAFDELLEMPEFEKSKEPAADSVTIAEAPAEEELPSPSPFDISEVDTPAGETVFDLSEALETDLGGIETPETQQQFDSVEFEEIVAHPVDDLTETVDVMEPEASVELDTAELETHVEMAQPAKEKRQRFARAPKSPKPPKPPKEPRAPRPPKPPKAEKVPGPPKPPKAEKAPKPPKPPKAPKTPGPSLISRIIRRGASATAGAAEGAGEVAAAAGAVAAVKSKAAAVSAKAVLASMSGGLAAVAKVSGRALSRRPRKKIIAEQVAPPVEEETIQILEETVVDQPIDVSETPEITETLETGSPLDMSGVTVEEEPMEDIYVAEDMAVEEDTESEASPIELSDTFIIGAPFDISELTVEEEPTEDVSVVEDVAVDEDTEPEAQPFELSDTFEIGAPFHISELTVEEELTEDVSVVEDVAVEDTEPEASSIEPMEPADIAEFEVETIPSKKSKPGIGKAATAAAVPFLIIAGCLAAPFRAIGGIVTMVRSKSGRTPGLIARYREARRAGKTGPTSAARPLVDEFELGMLSRLATAAQVASWGDQLLELNAETNQVLMEITEPDNGHSSDLETLVETVRAAIREDSRRVQELRDNPYSLYWTLWLKDEREIMAADVGALAKHLSSFDAADSLCERLVDLEARYQTTDSKFYSHFGSLILLYDTHPPRSISRLSDESGAPKCGRALAPD